MTHQPAQCCLQIGRATPSGLRSAPDHKRVLCSDWRNESSSDGDVPKRTAEASAAFGPSTTIWALTGTRPKQTTIIGAAMFPDVLNIDPSAIPADKTPAVLSALAALQGALAGRLIASTETATN